MRCGRSPPSSPLAVERRRCAPRRPPPKALAEANELRTALLAAVSHDLRTPLASIKASVDEPAPARRRRGHRGHAREFLETIDEETDRLNALVGNLLDMSRLQAGALELRSTHVGLDEVVPAALQSLGETRGRVDVDVPETLPRVAPTRRCSSGPSPTSSTTRSRASPPDGPIRVFEARRHGGGVDLRVVDAGPGIPPDEREQVFQPFQRLGDSAGGDGVGLGLAVARGFVEAMGGELDGRRHARRWH